MNVEIEFLEWVHPIAGVTKVEVEGGKPLVLKAKIKKEWLELTPTQVKLLYEGVREEAIKSGESLNWVFYTHINAALKEKNI